MPDAEFGEFHPHAGEFANPDNRLSSNRAAHRLDGTPRRRGEIEQKTFAGVAQLIDGVIHREGLFGKQPASEGEHTLRAVLVRTVRHQERDVAADIGTILSRRP